MIMQGGRDLPIPPQSSNSASSPLVPLGSRFTVAASNNRTSASSRGANARRPQQLIAAIANAPPKRVARSVSAALIGTAALEHRQTSDAPAGHVDPPCRRLPGQNSDFQASDNRKI
jgi:hypothetical protein